MHRRVVLAGLFASFLLAFTVAAQEGHPLAGTWHGEWKASAAKGTPVVLFMRWDGKAVTGMVNPGPNSIPFKTATLEPKGWMVHIEAGNIVIDGAIGDIGSYNRTITGTWTQGNQKGELKLRRD